MSNEELVAAIQNGEKRTGELWEQVQRLVKWKARRIFTALELRGISCGCEFDDLVQCGYLAMVTAVETYTPESSSFSTWLMYYLQKEFAEITGYRTKRGRCEPLNEAYSLDKPLLDGEDFTLADVVEDSGASYTLESVEDQIWLDQLREVLGEMMQEMPEKQADVLYRRYWQNQTYTEAGEEIGIAAQNVQVAERRGLRFLREPRNRKRLRPFYEFDCYSGTGLGAFKSSGASVQERYMERKYG